MNATQIDTTYKAILRFVSASRLKPAFDRIKIMIDDLQYGEFSDRFNELERNYKFLLEYYLKGVQDPERKSVYSKLVAKLLILLADVREELMMKNSSNFEYSQKRFFPYTRKHQTVNELFNALQYFHKQSALLSENKEQYKIELSRMRSNFEDALDELFGVFWLATRYTEEENNLYKKLLEADDKYWVEKSLMVSAVTLNLWRKFDEQKIMLLFDSCENADQKVVQRALVGLTFILAKYNIYLPYFPSIRNRLVLLVDQNRIAENFQNIIIQIIGTTETEKISRKLREEILPEMMKINPLLRDKMDAENFLNSDEWAEANPEWQEILDESGLSDKLKELSDLQLEGADVYMSTFSMLKNFTFFSQFSHWFLPFDTENSAVNQLFESDEKTILSAFVNSNVMCNSDKYSFCLSVLQMPESQRNMLKHSFKMESDQMDEMEEEMSILSPETITKNISKQYIQDLFRFFKLQPHKEDFEDMFSYSLTLHRTWLFDILSSIPGFSESVAEYYFSKGYYLQALELYEKIQSESQPSAALYQKMGYAYQQTSQLQKALDAYLKADMIQPDDGWTIRKIALCYRLLGNYEKALAFYQHADFLKPGQYSTQIHIAQCYFELGKFKDALAIYYKLDAENVDDIKVWKAIAKCNFFDGNLDKADYYSEKIILAEPNAYDYLLSGHISWCRRQLSAAANAYRKALEMLQNKWEVFQDLFNEDKDRLISFGIREEELPLMMDALLYFENE